MGSSYNVNVPFATMGQSVDRQIAEKKDRGFVANMQRLNKAISPHIMQGREQRFSERMQEDSQAHAKEIADLRFQNQKDMVDYSFTEELKQMEAKREKKKGWATQTHKSVSEYMKSNNLTEQDLATKSSAELAKGANITVDEAEDYIVGERSAQKYAEERDAAGVAKKTGALKLRDATLRLREIANQRFEAAERRRMLPFSKQLKDEARATEIALEKEENALKIQNIQVANAQREVDHEMATKELNRSTAELRNTLAQVELDANKKDMMIGFTEKAFGRSLNLISDYNIDLGRLEATINTLPDGLAKKGLVTKAMGIVEASNREARKIGHPIKYWDEEVGLAITDADATQRGFDDEDGIAELAKGTDSATFLVTALLHELDIESADTEFLVKFPRAMDKAGKEPTFVAEALQFYMDNKDRILGKRRKKMQAEGARKAPTTDAENTGPAPPPEPVAPGGFWGEGF